MRRVLCSALLIVLAIDIGGGNSVAFAQSDPAAVTQADIGAYIDFYEWHFEIRLNPDQRQKLLSLLEADLKKSGLAEEVRSKARFMADVSSKGWMELYSLHSDMKNIDTIEQATQDSLNGKGSEAYVDPLIDFYGGSKRPDGPAPEQKIYGTGVAASLRKSARSSVRSSAFLIELADGYRKPLIGDGSLRASLFRRDVDATFEWLSFRMVMVAQKRVVQGNSQERQQMERQIAETWRKNQSDPEQLPKYRDWLDSNVTEWLMWRAAKYSFFERLTPFGKKEQLARWAAEIVGISPDMKPFANQRIGEFRDYVAKMPADELKREFDLKERTNTEFKLRMQKMQNDMKSTQQTFAVMRQGLMNLHVANLNIGENIGNTGFVWKMQTNPY